MLWSAKAKSQTLILKDDEYNKGDEGDLFWSWIMSNSQTLVNESKKLLNIASSYLLLSLLYEAWLKS